MYKWNLIAAAVVMATFGLHASVSAVANRCVDAKGRVTYQDTACEKQGDGTGVVDTTDSISARPSGSTPLRGGGSQSVGQDNAYAIASRAWRGPVQFQLTLAGVRDGSAHAVTPMVIELRSDGEIVGVIPATGCTLSGLWTQFVAENMASVDISAKSCVDSRFNARYTGHLMVQKAAKEGKLNLHALLLRLPNGQFQQTSLEAVLRR